MATLPLGVTLTSFDSSDALLTGVAAHIAARLETARAVALTGGNTARALYGHLARDPRAASWRGIDWFWGDDRFVPVDHPDSNAGMTLKALGTVLETGQVHTLPADAPSAAAAADAYAATLKTFYGADQLQAGRPLLDLVLLVLGPDGHIASLLSGSAVLNEHTAWTAAVQGKDHPRVTLTLPVLQNAREVVMVVSGEAKRAALAGWIAGDTSLPVTALKPVNGIALFADAAALGQTALVN